MATFNIYYSARVFLITSLEACLGKGSLGRDKADRIVELREKLYSAPALEVDLDEDEIKLLIESLGYGRARIQES